MGSFGAFTPLMGANATQSQGLSITAFNPFPEVVVVPGVSYVQRVYSSGLSAWCYYTQSVINPTPASVDTTPNWTGSITAHEVLTII
jgi:hypothetical protein